MRPGNWAPSFRVDQLPLHLWEGTPVPDRPSHNIASLRINCCACSCLSGILAWDHYWDAVSNSPVRNYRAAPVHSSTVRQIGLPRRPDPMMGGGRSGARSSSHPHSGDIFNSFAAVGQLMPILQHEQRDLPARSWA